MIRRASRRKSAHARDVTHKRTGGELQRKSRPEKKKRLHRNRCSLIFRGGPTRNRTLNLLIKSQMLYQLSYWPAQTEGLSRQEGQDCQTKKCIPRNKFPPAHTRPITVKAAQHRRTRGSSIAEAVRIPDYVRPSLANRVVRGMFCCSGLVAMAVMLAETTGSSLPKSGLTLKISRM